MYVEYRKCLTAIPIIIEGLFQVFQRFASSKLVLKTVESCFVTLNYYGNGSMNLAQNNCHDLLPPKKTQTHVCTPMYTYTVYVLRLPQMHVNFE